MMPLAVPEELVGLFLSDPALLITSFSKRNCRPKSCDHTFVADSFEKRDDFLCRDQARNASTTDKKTGHLLVRVSRHVDICR